MRSYANHYQLLDLQRGVMMVSKWARNVVYDPDECCDICGHLGAYDFMGDYLCAECAREDIDIDEDEYIDDEDQWQQVNL